MKRLLLTFLVLGGCTCGLDDPPPTTDTPPPIPPGCGRLAVPTCWDDCCTRSSSPFIDSDCSATCSDDTRPFFDACVPEPWCTDGFLPPDPCSPDAGPPPFCVGGECCGAMEMARFDPETCGFDCPPGFSFTCTADPVSCSDDLRVCTEPSECVITSNACCHECGDPTLEGSTAVNRERASEFRDRLCVDTDGVCDACEPGWNPSLVATCNANRCAAVETARLPLAACATDDDCILRTRDCCECGGATSIESLVALRPDGLIDYLGLVCDTGAICDDCVPTYPPELHAVCLAGVCEVEFRPD